jgi:glucose/arabinose dehydrogenase
MAVLVPFLVLLAQTPPPGPSAAPAASSPSTGTTAVVPDQFTDTGIASITRPTAIAFMPDGRMLVTSQTGQLSVIIGDVVQPRLALDLSSRICTEIERGLLGVATDPDPSTVAVFLFYTAKYGPKSGCPSGSPNPLKAPRNRVSRFVLRPDNTINPTSETILLDGIYSPNGNHNAGDLHVGKDGNLYVSTGDGGCDYAGGQCDGFNDAARDMNVLLSKIIRISKTGGIPTDNPFQGTGTVSCRTAPAKSGKVCRETFASGLRNPFRMAFDPNAAGHLLPDQ